MRKESLYLAANPKHIVLELVQLLNVVTDHALDLG
jgi:hypothetical protein